MPELSFAPVVSVIPEYINPGVGRPDIALVRPGEPSRAFIELKSTDKPTDGTRWRDPHDRRQFKRFSEFACWAICNFHEFRLYERDESVGHAVLVPERALDPDQDDRKADRLVDKHDPETALGLIERLARTPRPQAQNAEELAELLAYSARLVRGIVMDRLAELSEEKRTDTALQQVRKEFRDVLYSHPEAAGYSSKDFDELFSGAFAQTLAFGLLLVRDATGENVGRHAYEHMPDEHPLMRTALRVLSMEDVADEIGAGFDVMLDTVNGLQPAMLDIRADGTDPILYFYEDFLKTFDPEARQKYGVYYTPIEVVRYMAGALDRALSENLDTEGLSDNRVHILDPAAGTGTFLLGVAERVRRRAVERDGPGQAHLAVQGLAQRMYGFELLVGPYAVAHYRLHHALSRALDSGESLPLQRLGVYLTDTLAEPSAAAPAGALGFVTEGIQDERAQSNRVKTEQPILGIIGNPPYRRLEEGENRTLVGRWMDDLWDDLKAPVRDASHGNQLNTFPELSVAFWRWSIWKLFEAPNAPRRGVVALITNRKFLTGWPYAGLRTMLRERFDRIEIIDLRGDVRRGERAGVEDDEGVFNIQVGTAITLAIADGSKEDGVLADVVYNDTWAHNLVSKDAKLDWLNRGADEGRRDNGVPVERENLDDFRPLPFMNGELISLRDAFRFTKSGMKSGNDPVFVKVRRVDLHDLVAAALPQGVPYNEARETFYGYRPLDRRWFYNELRLLNRPGPEMQRAWGGDNVGLYAMPSGTGVGPAVWCHGLLPDYHAFRGSYGGYAFPLYDRRAGHGPYNLRPELAAALSAAYGAEVTPETTFDAILCLLSAKSYTTRFAEDLEDVFPHVPFPAHLETFNKAARVGVEIRAVETFGRPPGDDFSVGLARAETAPKGRLGAAEWDEGHIILCEDGSGRISNIPQEVWEFSVSGYRVLPRWLAGAGRARHRAGFHPRTPRHRLAHRGTPVSFRRSRCNSRTHDR